MTHARASDGVRLHYEAFGRRNVPAVLMIQGLGADKHGWDMQRFALARNYRVIAFDNRGAGRSDKPFGPYSIEQMADDAVAVLDHAGVEAAHVIGASMGGAISQLMCLRHPTRVLSLTLACTACRNQPWRRELLERWMQTAQERGMGAMTSEAARWVMAPRSFRRLVPTFGWLGPFAMGRPAHSFAAQIRAILAASDELAEQLHNVHVPTLVIVGNQDILTPRGDSEEIADRIPGAELVVISGAAHGFMIEHASTFNKIVKEFLHRVSQAQPAATAVGSMIEFGTALRDVLTRNLANHHIETIPTDNRRRAAVAVVVVDSEVGVEDTHRFAPADFDMSDIPGDLSGFDGGIDGVGGGAAFLLCRRAAKMNRHAGQWALPGGKVDVGETPEAAAFREVEEELGLTLDQSQVLGRLDDYGTRSGFVITPIVVWAGADAELVPDPSEVAHVLRIGLHELCRPDSPRFVSIPESERPVVQLPIGRDLIHAPTGAVLLQFRWVTIEGKADARVNEFEQPVFAWR